MIYTYDKYYYCFFLLLPTTITNILYTVQLLTINKIIILLLREFLFPFFYNIKILKY
jgi:hypothetical protein